MSITYKVPLLPLSAPGASVKAPKFERSKSEKPIFFTGVLGAVVVVGFLVVAALDVFLPTSPVLLPVTETSVLSVEEASLSIELSIELSVGVSPLSVAEEAEASDDVGLLPELLTAGLLLQAAAPMRSNRDIIKAVVRLTMLFMC